MMHFLHDAEIAHQTPGRIRLRVAQRRGDAEFFSEAGRAIAVLDGVTRVMTNRHSRSITILHDDSFRLESISGALATVSLCERVASQESDFCETSSGPRVATETVSTLIQLAVAVLFGRALTHVLELLAKNLVQ